MTLIIVISVFLLIPVIIFSLRVDIFHPVSFFCSYMIVGVYVRSWVLNNPESKFGGTFWETVEWQLESHLNSSLMLLSVTIAFSLLLYMAPRRRARSNGFFGGVFGVDSALISPRKLLFISAFLLISYLFLLAKSLGGLAVAISILQKRSLVFDSEVFYIKIINIYFCVSVLLLYYCKRKNSVSFTRLMGLGAVLLIVLSLIILFLVGGRGAFLTQLLSLLYIYHATSSRKSSSAFFLSVLILVSMLGTIVVGLGVRESAQKDIPFGEAVGNSSKQLTEVITGTFPIIDLFTSAKYFADQVGHDNGQQFVNYLTRVIPRSIWPEKPLILGLQIRKYYSGHTLSGVPPTIFGEFYIAFGEIGLILCAVVLAGILRFLSSLHGAVKLNDGLSLIYITFLVQLIFSTFRAGLEISIFTIAYYISGIIFIKFFSSSFFVKERKLSRSPF